MGFRGVGVWIWLLDFSVMSEPQITLILLMGCDCPSPLLSGSSLGQAVAVSHGKERPWVCPLWLRHFPRERGKPAHRWIPASAGMTEGRRHDGCWRGWGMIPLRAVLRLRAPFVPRIGVRGRPRAYPRERGNPSPPIPGHAPLTSLRSFAPLSHGERGKDGLGGLFG